MCFSLGTGFLYINKHVCKRICPVWLQGRKDWIHAPVEAPCGGGGGVYTRFALRFVCLTFPPPPYFFSYLGLVLSLSRLRTRMSRNSSLESQAFVKRASTGNRLLHQLIRNPKQIPDRLYVISMESLSLRNGHLFCGMSSWQGKTRGDGCNRSQGLTLHQGQSTMHLLSTMVLSDTLYILILRSATSRKQV